MRRPPFLRWIAAASLVIVALGFELESRTSVIHPFLTRAVPPGEVITKDAIEWRPVPRGLLAMPDLEVPVAAHDLSAGDPLTPGAVTDQSIVPTGWWSIPLNLPASAYVGSRVRLVLLPSYNSESAAGAGGTQDTWVEGVVVAVGAADAFSVAEAGLVAVPPEAAQVVAVAAAEERLMVLYGP